MSIFQRIVLVVGITLGGLLAIAEWGRVDAAELNEEDFVPLATQGFLTAVDGPHPEGSPLNIYMWSMRWWEGKLYVGTLRGGESSLALQALGPEQRAEIWAYTPGGEGGSQGTWQRVFQSPMVLDGLTELPRDVGYRNMVDCDAGGKQTLYAVTLGVGGRVVYTPDGTTFQQASSFGLDLINDLGYRAMACWRGRLWISPAGMLSGNSLVPDNAFHPVLLVNDDPSSSASPWRAVLDVVNDPQLGDAGNVGIYSMAVFGDALYLGVANQTTGFEIWKADGARCPRPPRPCELAWEKLIDDGGGRPLGPDGTPNNARIFDFGEFNGDLYWGASESAVFKMTTGELGRIGPDGRWDLIVGEPRDASAMAASPNFNCHLEDASCVPLSGLGPGFGPTPLTPGSSLYIWKLQAHDGALYAGTPDGSGVMGAPVPPGEVPGFNLWRSSNGTAWSLVSNDGFGNPSNFGARTMASAPVGLFVGTTNLDEGGEVWLGIDRQEVVLHR